MNEIWYNIGSIFSFILCFIIGMFILMSRNKVIKNISLKKNSYKEKILLKSTIYVFSLFNIIIIIYLILYDIFIIKIDTTFPNVIFMVLILNSLPFGILFLMFCFFIFLKTLTKNFEYKMKADIP
jgi:hypothetical protein